MARIVFDLDGTLIDSAPDLQAVANDLLSARGAAPLDLDEVRSFIGKGAAVFVERVCVARRIPPEAQGPLLDAFLAAYEGAVSLTRPYPGVIDALGALQRAGHRLGLCTNKPHGPARAVLGHLGLDRFFETVIAGDSLPQRKPDPAPLRAAFTALGAGSAFYVGDSEIDARTAEAAAVPFVLFTEGYRQAPVAALPHRAAFSDFAKLPALMGAAA